MRERIKFDKKEQLGAKEQSIRQVTMESEEDHRGRQIEETTLVGGEKFIVKTRLSATEIIQQMPNTFNQFSSNNNSLYSLPKLSSPVFLSEAHIPVTYMARNLRQVHDLTPTRVRESTVVADFADVSGRRHARTASFHHVVKKKKSGVSLPGSRPWSDFFWNFTAIL